MSQSIRHLYEFGPFRLDVTDRLLLRDEQHIPLTPKAFETLLLLVEHGGHVIRKDDLIKKVWPDTFVEEVNLAKNISCLRKVLGDERSGPYIETIPKRGYRFVAGVKEIWQDDSTPPMTESIAPSVGGRQFSRANGTRGNAATKLAPDVQHEDSYDILVGRYRDRRAVWLFGVLALAVTATLLAWRLALRPTTSVPASLRIVPVTSFPGNVDQAAFSPDGNQLAFVWNGEKEDNTDIYVKLIGAERPLRLTNDPAPETNPTWAPDGRQIGFLRESAKNGGIFVVSALGGAERKLADAFPYRPVVIGNSLNYSPDGKLLVYPDKSTQAEPFSIFSLLIETAERTKLTSPSAGTVGDLYPAYSPDQKLLAFVRSDSIAAADIYLLPAVGGEPKRLTRDHASIRGLSWTSDGRQIVFASRRGGSTYNLWKVSVASGVVEQLMTRERDVFSPTISRRDNRLAFTESLMDSNIWRLKLSGWKGQLDSPVKFIASSQEENGPQYSPDGKKIVFVSRRSGSFEIWICDSDSSNPRQLTNIGGPLTGTPRWSPDGGQIVFDSWIEGNADIYVINADGGKPRRLTYDADEDVTPSWSRDGRWIYFGCTRSGSMQIWRVPAEGDQAVQVTRQGGFEGFESPDGKFFYYAKGRAVPGIWRVPVGGGEETLVVDHHQAGLWRYWAVTDKGIYFATAEIASRPIIEFFNFATSQITQVAKLDKPLFKTDPGLAISPDGQTLLIVQVDQSGTDIELVENFH